MTKLLIWLTVEMTNLHKSSMTIQQFQKKFNKCQIPQLGGDAIGKDDVVLRNGIVLCEVHKMKCAYLIERKASHGFLAVFSVDKIWEQEYNRFCKEYGAEQNISTIPEEFSCYLCGQRNGQMELTQRCEEIVLRDVGQVTDVYCIERKELQPHNSNRRRVVKQLQGGADCVSKNLNSGGNIRFRPVLVAKPREKPTIFPANKFFVKFNKTKYGIKCLEEGERLPDIKKLPDIQNGI